MCEHSETFDHYDFGEPWPLSGCRDLCTRQCLTCLHFWRVSRPDIEQPLPSRQQVLADVAAWKARREYAENHGLL